MVDVLCDGVRLKGDGTLYLGPVGMRGELSRQKAESAQKSGTAIQHSSAAATVS